MNSHLKLVFQVLLPKLEEAGVEYWVYGGVGVAAYVGIFIRENDDVDIFVKELDFDKVKSILENICSNQSNIHLKLCKPLDRGGYQRPKLEVKTNAGDEIMSVVPAYVKNDIVTLVFGQGPEDYSNEVLQKVERNLSGYKFVTPVNEYVKRIFTDCLPFRINGKSKQNVQKDAKAILSPEEYRKYYPSQN